MSNVALIRPKTTSKDTAFDFTPLKDSQDELVDKIRTMVQNPKILWDAIFTIRRALSKSPEATKLNDADRQYLLDADRFLTAVWVVSMHGKQALRQRFKEYGNEFEDRMHTFVNGADLLSDTLVIQNDIGRADMTMIQALSNTPDWASLLEVMPIIRDKVLVMREGVATMNADDEKLLAGYRKIPHVLAGFHMESVITAAKAVRFIARSDFLTKA